MLTLKEVKSLDVGDWIWIESGNGSYYAQVLTVGKDSIELKSTVFEDLTDSAGWLYYYNYGTAWEAYKNKEQAKEAR